MANLTDKFGSFFIGNCLLCNIYLSISQRRCSIHQSQIHFLCLGSKRFFYFFFFAIQLWYLIIIDLLFILFVLIFVIFWFVSIVIMNLINNFSLFSLMRNDLHRKLSYIFKHILNNFFMKDCNRLNYIFIVFFLLIKMAQWILKLFGLQNIILIKIVS